MKSALFYYLYRVTELLNGQNALRHNTFSRFKLLSYRSATHIKNMCKTFI